MDSNGNLFFGLMSPIALGCWDSSRPYDREHMRVVAHNNETLQFASGIKVVLNRKGKEELWVLTCSFQVRNSISIMERNCKCIFYTASDDWKYQFT